MRKVSDNTRAIRLEADKAADKVTMGFYNAGQSAVANAKNLQAAFRGYSLGRWDATAKNGKGSFVPSERYNMLYERGKIGYVAARLVGDNQATTDSERLAKAKAVCEDKNRGDTFNTMLAAFRQDWGRTLKRAGLETPRGKPKAPKGSAGQGTGQGETDQPKTIAVPLELAKALPPREPNRENVVEYIRETLGAMALAIDVANQSAAKRKGKAVPPQIQTAIEEWRTSAKAWVI